MKNEKIKSVSRVTAAAALSDQRWYSVRSIVRRDLIEDGKPRRSFEERVVLIRAIDYEEALEKGEAEAKRYASELGNCKMLDHFVVHVLHDGDLCEGEEVWSCIRDLDFTNRQFLHQIYHGEIFSWTNIYFERRKSKMFDRSHPFEQVVKNPKEVKKERKPDGVKRGTLKMDLMKKKTETADHKTAAS
jgi:hypothetical protein